MHYHIKIFGCQMNQSDGERIASLLEKHKLKSAASIDEADLIVFITCGVRQSAEDRVYGQINNLRRKYSNKKIILTGCLADRKDVQKRLKNKVDLFFPINNFDKFESWIIETCLQIGNRKLENSAQKNYFRQKNSYLSINPKYSQRYTAFVPVMTGCNNFCAYCVVPYARGQEYSRPAEDIIKEVKNLIKKGYKEIILLGQNVNSYYSRLNVENSEIKKLFQNSIRQPADKIKNSVSINFAKLLKIIESIPGYFWITFLTSHPKDMSDELIETIAKSKKVCKYISLPVQSGDNQVLRKMNRHYTIKHYKNLVKKIRQSFLGIQRLQRRRRIPIDPLAISTDIIVGFPGETKNQFENTAKLLREIKFDMAYIAQYSPRPETLAWKMQDNISKKEKEKREKILMKILEKTAMENNKKYIGEIVEVLVDKKLGFGKFHQTKVAEGKSQVLDSQKYLAHTRTQKKVIFYTNKKISIGSFQKIKITKAKSFGLEGEIK